VSQGEGQDFIFDEHSFQRGPLVNAGAELDVFTSLREGLRENFYN
jgi:hypothetical protein